ncbi:MAG TPA: hypothetical protein VFT83_05015 [Nitrososphaeraceae archaeon]|nr:hypothetical protein [Nitrososphaeraceae archaeon]
MDDGSNMQKFSSMIYENPICHLLHKPIFTPTKEQICKYLFGMRNGNSKRKKNACLTI